MNGCEESRPSLMEKFVMLLVPVSYPFPLFFSDCSKRDTCHLTVITHDTVFFISFFIFSKDLSFLSSAANRIIQIVVHMFTAISKCLSSNAISGRVVHIFD